MLTAAEKAAYQRAYRKKNKARINAINRKYRSKNPAKARSWDRASKIRRGELPEPTRPMPIVCESCGRPPGKTSLHLDHDHVTGAFRGWLCSRCNTALGLVGDTLESVLCAVRYLQRAEDTR